MDMFCEHTALKSNLGWVDQGRLPGGGDACPDPAKLTRRRRNMYMAGGLGREQHVKTRRVENLMTSGITVTEGLFL